jgi:hypothetical protein
VASFFFRKRFINNIDGDQRVEALPGTGRSQWLVMRALCLYKLFFIPVAAGEKKEAIALQLLRWSPFANTGEYIVWHNDYAMVWIWDEALRAERVAGSEGVKAQPIPEDLFFMPPAVDGVRLLRCLNGIVAEYWQEGFLYDSRWWATRPAKEELHNFYRNNDLELPQELPDEITLPLQRKPRAANSALKSTAGSQLERYFLLLMGVFLLLPLFQGIVLFKWTGLEQELKQQASDLTAQVEPVLTARRGTMEQQAEITEYLKLAPYPEQLHIWAAVVRTLRVLGATVQLWRYQNGTLELRIQGGNSDPGTVIRAFSEDNLFNDISASSVRNQDAIDIRMVIQKAENDTDTAKQ